MNNKVQTPEEKARLQAILEKKQKKILEKKYEKQQQQQQQLNQTTQIQFDIKKIQIQNSKEETKKLYFLTLFPKSLRQRFEKLPKQQQEEIQNKFGQKVFSADLTDHYVIQNQQEIEKQLQQQPKPDNYEELRQKLKDSKKYGIESELYQEIIKELRKIEEKFIKNKIELKNKMSKSQNQIVKVKNDPMIMHQRIFKIEIEDKLESELLKEQNIKKKYIAETSLNRIEQGGGYLVLKRDTKQQNVSFSMLVLNGAIQVEDEEQLKLSTLYGQPRKTEEIQKIEHQYIQSKFKGSANTQELKEKYIQAKQSSKNKQQSIQQQYDDDDDDDQFQKNISDQDDSDNVLNSD